MSKKAAVYVALALTCGMLVSYGRHLLTSAGQQGRQPLVITKKTILHDSAGVEKLHDIETIAYRQDGSVARFSRKIHVESGMQGEFGEITDVQAGTRTHIDYGTKSISTTQLTDEVLVRLAVKPSCGNLRRAKGKEMAEFLGFEAVRETVEILSSNIERWVAPELDCLVMKEIQRQIKPDGGKGAWNTVEVLSVDLGEPLSHLFQVPSGFTERSPSEMVIERNLLEQRMAGVEGSAEPHGVPESVLRQADARYELSKPDPEKKAEPPQH